MILPINKLIIVIAPPLTQLSQAIWGMYLNRNGVRFVDPKYPRAIAPIQATMDNISLRKPRATDTIIDIKTVANTKASKSIGE